MNPFSFSMLQQPFNVHGQLNQITDYNPFGMGIPNNSQTPPYLQYQPYQPGQSPYTQWFGNQISNYDPNYYAQLMELMNQTPEQQYLAPFQQTAEDARQAQVAAQNQPIPVPAQPEITADQLAEVYKRTNTFNPDGPNVQWNMQGARIEKPTLLRRLGLFSGGEALASFGSI